MTVPRVAVLVGSLRKASLSRKVAVAISELAESRLATELIDISGLDLYDEDAEDAGPPLSWRSFRDTVRRADAVLFVTPEYNRSIPGALKNAIDVGSRPKQDSVWKRKPGAVISVSPGAIGGFGANHHLRQALVFLDVPAMAQPEAYIGHADSLFDEQGRLADATTRNFLGQFVESYATWIDTLGRAGNVLQ